MTLSALLGIMPSDRVAVIGAGGKTTLIDRLADENGAGGVIIAPTTRIGLDEVRPRAGIEYLGSACSGKLICARDRELNAAAGGGKLLLMEADGSAGKPLKGWAEHEPVVPGFTTLTACIVSAQCIGLEVSATNVHRPEMFRAMTGLGMGDISTPGAAVKMVQTMMGFARGRKVLVINQADDSEALESALSIARALDGLKIIIGSCLNGIFYKWSDC